MSVFSSAIAFSALDLPLEFLMPNIANFYSNRGAFEHYIESCQDKQQVLLESLNDITDWRLRMAIEDGGDLSFNTYFAPDKGKPKISGGTF